MGYRGHAVNVHPQTAILPQSDSFVPFATKDGYYYSELTSGSTDNRLLWTKDLMKVATLNLDVFEIIQPNGHPNLILSAKWKGIPRHLYWTPLQANTLHFKNPMETL